MDKGISKKKITNNLKTGTRLLAALPLLLHTLMIVLPVTYLLFRQKKIYISDIPLNHQIMLSAFVIVPFLVLVIGCIIGLIKKIPDWSFSWFATTILTFFIIFMLAFDDKEDSVLSVSLFVILIFAFLCFLVISANRGWQSGGFYGIALAGAFAVNNCFFMTAAPFSQYALAMTALPVGLVSAFFIYHYQNSKNILRIFIFTAMAAINIMITFLQYSAYSTVFIPYNGTFPIIALLVSTIMLISGPLFGLVMKNQKAS